MRDFPNALAHHPIVEVFPDVFMMTGGFSFAPGVSVSRNMTIVRQGSELTILNSVRPTAEGEAALLALGTPKHVVRVGFAHGADDPWFVDRFGARLWAPPGIEYAGGPAVNEQIVKGHSPIEGSEVFAFENGAKPEVAVRLDTAGGALVTCDSYQHWTNFDDCSFLGRLMMRAMGFGPTLIGGPWAKMMGPNVRKDFERLLELPFQHLLPAHGTVLKDNAVVGLKTAIQARYGP